MRPEDLTDDAKAILLLCGHFAQGKSTDGPTPLGTAEYARFSVFLRRESLRPAALLEAAAPDGLPQGLCPVEIPRLHALLSRGAEMSFAIEAWMNKGLWVLCRSDDAYPQRLKRKFQGMAPPILYGAGDAGLLDRGGLAVVGSRNIGTKEEDFTASVARRCARDGMQVVSGGARGVDEVSMREAMAAGGCVVGVLADGLLRKSLRKEHREAIHDRRLAMISTVHPEAGFNVGAAMGRNKLIYALADFGLAVKAELKKGGTWAGAEDELKRTNGCPVFIHPEFSASQAVDALVSLGARSFPELRADTPLPRILSLAVASAPVPAPAEGMLDLFPEEQPSHPTPKPPTRVAAENPEPAVPSCKEEPKTFAVEPSLHAPVFEAVWPLLARELETPRSSAELAKAMELRKSQVDDWLKHACNQGLARKLAKPVRFVRNPPES